MSEPLSVLLVDDSADENWLNAMRLRKLGMTVVAALNGDDALEALRQLTPDLLIVDYSLRETTGPQVVSRILASKDLDPYCVIATGHAQDEIEVGCDLMDKIVVVQKPLTHQKLVQLIEDAALHKRNRTGLGGEFPTWWKRQSRRDDSLGRTES